MGDHKNVPNCLKINKIAQRYLLPDTFETQANKHLEFEMNLRFLRSDRFMKLNYCFVLKMRWCDIRAQVKGLL